MGKRIFHIALGALVLIPAAAAHPATSYPVTLPDGLGGTITLQRRPERMISLAPSTTEILFAVGAGDRVVGVTRFCNYPPEAQWKKRIGGYTDIQLEVVLSLKSDLILASRGNPRANIERLKEHGLTVLGVDAQSIPEVLEAVRLVGRATGNTEQAETVAREMARTIETARRAIAGAETRPRAYFGSLSPPLFAAGPNSFIGKCVEAAGGDNIIRAPREPWPILSMETIIKQDPEVIVVGLDWSARREEQRQLILKRLRADPVWSTISAVKTGRVHTMDEDAVHRAGPRIAQVVADMARLFYPERFADNGAKKPQ